MELTIVFESSIPRTSVALHAWEPQGKVWDIVQHSERAREFQFQLRGSVADQCNVRFKFRFPDEHRWEPDEYIRRIPQRGVQRFWCYDCSPRISVRPPVVPSLAVRAEVMPPAESARVLSVRVLTRQRYVGGALYVWKPGTEHSAWFTEQSRDASRGTSEFRLALQPWMAMGFHFKLVDAQGHFESEACNRVWRPGDGDNIVVKSGQATLLPPAVPPLVAAGTGALGSSNAAAPSNGSAHWTAVPHQKHMTIGLIYPTSLGAPPELLLTDRSGDPYEEVVRASSEPMPLARDSRFCKASYAVMVYPEAAYEISLRDPAIEGAIVRPLCVATDEAPGELLTVLGDSRWVADFPQAARVSLVFHPRAWTRPITRLAFDLSVGNAGAFEHATARRQPDDSWRAEATVPVGLSLNATPTANEPLDRRPEGPVCAARRFALERSEAHELHTVDAQPGFVRRPLSVPAGSREVPR